MNFKLLKNLSFFFFFLTAIEAAAADNVGGVWTNSPLGKCYSSLENYLTTTFGAEYKGDENIQIVDAYEASEEYKWVRDVTPGVNITRVMFKIENDRRACAILFIPFASTVRESREKGSDFLPLEIITTDSPPPGFPETEVIYRLDKKMQTYFPHQCFKRSVGKKKFRVRCTSLYSETTEK